MISQVKEEDKEDKDSFNNKFPGKKHSDIVNPRGVDNNFKIATITRKPSLTYVNLPKPVNQDTINKNTDMQNHN